MAIAPQPAMPHPPETMRPRPTAVAVTSRHTVLVPVPERRTGVVAARLAVLMAGTSFAFGTAIALVLAIATGALAQLGH